ncbi:hypothetical protein P280DRAFT_474164 [Massarina eburnea CBS 473.64]|uniref:Zn(2)-C6 fungal-type domain-containing protein n=1 Tax=Massarina eburnea CBS 473.64 TaxID=1395130 RepID=A0A6A6RJ02_9PLEO|nr:hypothetical protein P280DRAFT_474164 [Massarina eburnea CBS 473.64]
MAETVTIPSPSLFPRSPSPTEQAVRQPVRKAVPKPAESSGVTKRKQSKSRNGCVTCKAKRLKCDETKPTCQQCERRSVTCGGYKKDFKWRPFEETTFGGGKALPKAKKDSPPHSAPAPPNIVPPEPHYHHPPHHPPYHHQYRPVHSFEPPHNVYYPPPQPQHPMHGLHHLSTYVEPTYHAMASMYAISQPSPYMLGPPPISPVESIMTGSAESTNDMFESESVDTRQTKRTAPSSVSSGQSPRLVDLLLPGTDLNVPPEEYSSFREQHESFYQPSGFTPPADLSDDDVEEIPRDADTEYGAWGMRLPSPAPSNSSSSSGSIRFPMCTAPRPSSTDMLTRRFDRETCGILSVKDGPTENPWRTLIWPLTRDCPALYYAIASMTSFHQSRDTPALRIQGIDHMRTAVHALASSLENMRVDAAISTTLVLAFSESWDQHISTGINHIKGAKMLIDRALVQHSRTPMRGDELLRLQFLCNTWTYIDVIARLTSADDDGPNDYDSVFDSFHVGGPNNTQVDPLMGCAGTLFPIIGRVANLVRKVRRSNSHENSPTIISQAVVLKRQLEAWSPPSCIETPEDETTSVQDSITTATAYQYATLLYLHQAVPEVPSLPSLTLAQKICRELATVSISSRAIIVQIYPLMAAGCEVVGEYRHWVRERWEMMSIRMKIGIIEKCLDVTKEVWSRRDAYAVEGMFNQPGMGSKMPPARLSLKRSLSSVDDSHSDGDFPWLEPSAKRRASSSDAFQGGPQSVPVKSEMSAGIRRSDVVGTEDLEAEFTVKGRLHWLGVMKDWNWEILLG